MAFAVFWLWVGVNSFARASVTLLLEQPYGDLGKVNPAGHSAIYLDHVCAESPLQLRPCRPGELGVVISRYDDIDGYDWVAIPLLPYLYAVETAESIPQSVDSTSVSLLRNRYRRTHLEAIAPDDSDGVPPDGNWYELIGSAFDRTIYGFQVRSTEEQDQRLMALLNDRKNVQRYNGAFRNCADFARVTLNLFYPHAVRRNLIADLGLTTPKSVARALTHYAAKHPEAGLQVFVIPQVKGPLPRSHSAQGVAESLVKRYGVPLTLLSPVATGMVFVAYLGHGRFDMPRNAPVLDLTTPLQTSDPLRRSFALGAPVGAGPAARNGAAFLNSSESAKLAVPGGTDPVSGAPVSGAPASGALGVEVPRGTIPAAELAPASGEGKTAGYRMVPASLPTPAAAEVIPGETIPAVPLDLPGSNLPLFR